MCVQEAGYFLRIKALDRSLFPSGILIVRALETLRVSFPKENDTADVSGRKRPRQIPRQGSPSHNPLPGVPCLRSSPAVPLFSDRRCF